MSSIAIIICDLERGRFGHRAALGDDLAGKPVLQHTIDRAAKIDGLDRIVLLHPQGQLLEGAYQQTTKTPAIYDGLPQSSVPF